MRLLTVILLSVFSLSCARNTLSERDSRRDQLRNSAQSKRQELEPVVGTYWGKLVQEDGTEQSSSLRLEVKDVPTPVEGQVDPVMTPILAGYLRFHLSQTEYVGFSIEKAEFDPKRNVLDLTVHNESFKDILLSLQWADPKLAGSWTAPGLSTSGKAAFERGGNPDSSLPSLKGTYLGSITTTNPDASLPERAMMSLVTTQDLSSPSGLKITGNLRLYLGSFESLEFIELPFEEVQYNFSTKVLTAKTGGAEHITIKGEVSYSGFEGKISTDALGEVGDIELEKQ